MTPVGAWFITFLNSLGNRQSSKRRDVIYHVPSQRRVHCATYLFLGYANKINKRAVLATNTADICRQVVVQCRKTLNFGITRKMLIIRTVDFFDTKKKTKQFQEPPLLEAKSAASCRWNRCFLHQEPSLFEIKSAEWSSFLLSSVFKDAALCHADLANYQFWFSISLKKAKMIFLDDM